MAKDTPTDLDWRVYDAVAGRRTNFDTMLWQVPALSFTAQAFLFAVALNADTSHAGRVISSGLGAVIVGMCILLMAKQRQAELTDSEWLEKFEKRADSATVVGHGKTWAKRRKKKRLEGELVKFIPLWNAFKVWTFGSMVFLVTWVVIFGISIRNPDAFSGTENAHGRFAHEPHRVHGFLPGPAGEKMLPPPGRHVHQ